MTVNGEIGVNNLGERKNFGNIKQKKTILSFLLTVNIEIRANKDQWKRSGGEGNE